ncbi:MAG: translation initiation factor IF-2 subunit gamma [Candidatus Iainarchaeum archaeon]|uniref:protein-synthesizing GTPase n=1 Tax=Candidatus Iainarchaeum sp. TaxID=3101447 RepID=A0A7T9DK77_9ARCH|nr:MAG: translation initiation factor IF-2 subunit gamma [Candidatus Diapherotrites archaeon]
MSPRPKKTKEEVVAPTTETTEATASPIAEKTTKPRAKKTKTETKTETETKHEKATPAEAAHESKHPKTHILQAEINIGMTGHVDHGKTSLTKALTGKWTDTHSEELKRGISIRLGYADALFYEYPGLEGAAKFGSLKEKEGKQGKILRKVSFIDAPGHETLMTTMLSGAALMDGALLVIAANEPCPQPRTAEHLMALKIGNIQNVIVVQNKVDLVTKENALKSYNEIKKFLADYGYTNAPIIPVSANFNANVDALIQTIQEHIPTPKGDVEKPFKMYISRSFDVNKPGTELDKMLGGVLGGSISQGTLVKGQKVEVTPGIEGKPIQIEITSVRNADGELDRANPRGLIAAGTKLDPGITSMDKFKGQILCAPGTLPAPTDKLAIDFFELDRLLGNKLPFPHVHELMVLTVGTNTIVGEVVNVKKSRIDLVLKSKMTIEKGQKIAISRRETAAWRLAGYGIAV